MTIFNRSLREIGWKRFHPHLSGHFLTIFNRKLFQMTAPQLGHFNRMSYNCANLPGLSGSFRPASPSSPGAEHGGGFVRAVSRRCDLSTDCAPVWPSSDLFWHWFPLIALHSGLLLICFATGFVCEPDSGLLWTDV